MNNIFKSTLAFATGLAISSSSLAKDVLVVWEDVGKGYSINQAVSDFKKENDCEVIVKEINSIYALEEYQKVKEKPDVFILLSDKTNEAVSKGVIESLDFMAQDQELYAPLAVNVFTFDKKIWAAPRSIETLVVFYNKNILEYPYETFDDYITFAKVRNQDNKFSLIGKFDDLYYSYGIISGFGGYIFGKNIDGSYNVKDVGLNIDGSLKGLEYIKKISKYCTPKSILSDNGLDKIDSMFINGEAAAVISGPWKFHKYEMSNVYFGVAPLPSLPNGKNTKPFYGVKGYVVSSNSKQKELAHKFIQHLNKPIYSLMRYLSTKELPASNAVITNPIITNDELAKAVLSQLKQAENMPSIPKISEVWKNMRIFLSEIISDQKSVKKAADEASAKIKAL